jgi:hypothetical protein
MPDSAAWAEPKIQFIQREGMREHRVLTHGCGERHWGTGARPRRAP